MHIKTKTADSQIQKMPLNAFIWTICFDTKSQQMENQKFSTFHPWIWRWTCNKIQKSALVTKKVGKTQLTLRFSLWPSRRSSWWSSWTGRRSRAWGRRYLRPPAAGVPQESPRRPAPGPKPKRAARRKVERNAFRGQWISSVATRFALAAY